MSQCWICGAIANSGEHIVKKTDLKRHMNNVSQSSPIHHRRIGQKKRPIGGFNAEALKHEKSICIQCNGALTQKHDEAWDKLSEYLNVTTLPRGANVKLDSVFPSNAQEQFKFVHLYFAKLFGCKVNESELVLSTSDIAQSIKSDSECLPLYIKVSHSDNGKSDGYCASSDLEVFRETSGIIKYVHFFYTVGNYTIDVMYSEDPTGLELEGYFQPSEIIDSFDVCEIEYPQKYNVPNS